MNRKHFVLIAEVIRQSIEDATQREATAYASIAALHGTNPNFDANRFLVACVGSGGAL